MITDGSSMMFPESETPQRMVSSNSNPQYAQHIQSALSIQTLWKERISFLWCLFGVWVLIVATFDYLAGFFVVGIPEFRKDFGYPYDDDFVIDASWLAAFNGAPQAASVVGSLGGAWIADYIGRKIVITSGVLITFIGATLEFVATTPQLFFAGKLINGLAIGSQTAIVLTWITEISPISLRGLVTGLCNVSFCIGPFVGTLMANGLSAQATKWAYRSLFAAQWGFGVTALILCPVLPESPWWLTRQGRESDAKKALLRLGIPKSLLCSHIESMRLTQAAANTGDLRATYFECFQKPHLRRTIVTIMPLAIQSCSGVIYIGTYGTYYFQLAGIDPQISFRISCGAQALSIAGTITALFFVDRLGRRPLLLWAFGFLTIMLCVTGGLGTMTSNSSAVLATVAFIVAYNFFFNLAIGAVVWCIVAETANSRLRAKTIAMATTIQGCLYTMWQFVLPYLVNPDQANLGARTAFIFGGLSVFSWVYFYFYQPETARRSLDEIDEMFTKEVPARAFRAYVTDAQRRTQSDILINE